MTDAEFKTVADDVRILAKRPSDDEFTELYSLYKQATVGDCNIQRPGMTDPIGQKKYDAWLSKKGISKEDASKRYVAAGKAAVAKYGLKK